MGLSFGIVDSNFILAVKTNSVAFIGARARENKNFFKFSLPSLNELIFSDKLKVFKMIETLLKLEVAFRTMSIAS